MAKKKNATKQTPEKESSANLEKFAIFFEQQNSKSSARKLMWSGVVLISTGILFFVVYAAKMQIGAFAWDQETLNIKDSAQQSWSESFAKQEKERGINDIKKQVSEFLQQITSTTTTSTTTMTTNTIKMTETNITSTINSTTTSSIKNK